MVFLVCGHGRGGRLVGVDEGLWLVVVVILQGIILI